MKLLNHHKWIKQPGFRTWKCEKCGAVRYWDRVLQRMMFIKHNRMYYFTPDCNSIINCDPVYKMKQMIK